MSWQMGQPLIMQTERFIVRSLGPKDAGPVYTSKINIGQSQGSF